MITFTNNINDNIIEPFEVLLRAEMTAEDVGFGEADIVINPAEDTLLGLRGNGQVRDYSIQLIYSYRAGTDYKREDQFQHLTDQGERIKRLIWNNTDTANWFDCRVDSIAYEQDEDDRELFKATLEVTFSREEVI